MPKQRTARQPTTAYTTTQHELTTPLRRSKRILQQKPHDVSTDNPVLSKNHTDYTRKAFNELRKSEESSSICSTPALGLRRSPRFSKRVEAISNVRRSLRLSLLGNNNAIQEKNDEDKSTKSSYSNPKKLRHSSSNKSTDNKEVLLNKEKGEACVGSCDEIMKRSEWRTQGCAIVEVVLGLEAAKGKIIPQRRKRKRGEEGNNGSVKGWSKEQEAALQRAYFAAKPTPHFWKKVSKLVPGKTAQDCFEKIHSDHVTPPQPLPRSRAKRLNSSPFGCFSLSAGKLVGSSELKVKRFCHKQKSHIAKRTARNLLQKHNQMDQNYEADLFSILEPNVNLSRQDTRTYDAVSTPKHSPEKQGFLKKCHERSFGKKIPLSRFRSSCGTDIVSPPVLKQVKNKALHEKYIDQLHYREAKRKAACPQAGTKSSAQVNILKVDVVRAAKNALVSDVKDAINKLQDLQTNAKDDSFDFDNDGVSSDDAEVDGF